VTRGWACATFSLSGTTISNTADIDLNVLDDDDVSGYNLTQVLGEAGTNQFGWIAWRFFDSRQYVFVSDGTEEGTIKYKWDAYTYSAALTESVRQFDEENSSWVVPISLTGSADKRMADIKLSIT
jgi:hypothetical protein